jgi:hypothetical protein
VCKWFKRERAKPGISVDHHFTDKKFRQNGLKEEKGRGKE